MALITSQNLMKRRKREDEVPEIRKEEKKGRRREGETGRRMVVGKKARREKG